MATNNPLRLVLCWHMHQPEYRDLQTGEYQLPWTYLHVIKDYVDMAAHLEANPKAKAVVNFAPILLEQIEGYAGQVNGFLHGQDEIRDPLLQVLAVGNIPDDPKDKLILIKECLRANQERLINRYPEYQRLAEMAGWLEQNFEALDYINEQFVIDLLVWYHLAWMGETVKRHDQRIQHLICKARIFSKHDRLEIIQIIGELLAQVLCSYKNLAKSGQVELSVSPYAHPIMPLLLDVNSALEAMPNADLPEIRKYPGGLDRVYWHLEQGTQIFQRFFGCRPKGCWPSEGGISEQTVEILDDFGFAWVASGGGVLENSLKLPENKTPESHHHPFQLNDLTIKCFFRDDGLSDLIGFQYANWHADDAVNNLIHHLENIGESISEKGVVSIILDGENAWEYFPDNGYHFLDALYNKLSAHHSIQLTTFSECLEDNVESKPLARLVAGSWVYGTFSTWIGDADKNRGWDMLGDAKKAFDLAITEQRLKQHEQEAAERQLAVCEGSDWFWWFGDYNPGEAVSNFEQQFRLNLTNLYALLGDHPPAYLALSFTQGSGAPAMGGAMRPGIE